MAPILEPSAPPPPSPPPPPYPSATTSAPPPPPPPPLNEPINIRPNAHIRPLHFPHLPDYDPTTSTQPPSPPPNHYHNHHYPPVPSQDPSSPSSEATSASLPPPPRPAPQPAPEKQVTRPLHQTNLPKPAVAKQESHPLCYIFLGALLSLFFNVFAFLFLCCPSGMGIHGRRRPNFVAGVVIGALINAAAIACLYFFVVGPIVDDL